MKSDGKKLRRYVLFLPVNDKTKIYIFDIIAFLHEEVGGCTYTRFHDPPINLGNEEICGYLIGKFDDYPDEDVICLIADVDVLSYPDKHYKLKGLISKIESMGEKKVWLTYNDIILCQYKHQT